MATLVEPTSAMPTAPAPGLPSSVPVEKLTVKHPEYVENQSTWAKLGLLYGGGSQILRQAAQFLRRKTKETQDSYSERLALFSYQNILGSGVDWYLASMFAEEPELEWRQTTRDGESVPAELNRWSKVYYDNFIENCNRKQQRLANFFRDVLRVWLLYRTAWVLIDLPKADTPPESLGEQQERGWLDPYLVLYEPTQVINWSSPEGEDEVDWLVIETETETSEFLKKPGKKRHWYYFDRQAYAVYEELKSPGGATSTPGGEMAILVDEGRHATAELNVVPVQRMIVPEGLWLANRVLPQVLDHLNQDNAYGYALYRSNLAIPVVIGDITETPNQSEAGYLRLPKGSMLAWTEPPGGTFARAEYRINSLREEIYRQMYLMAQGRSSAASPGIQSGYSKELDMVPASQIQNMLGELLRESMQSTLNLIAKIRQEAIEAQVTGFDFIEEPDHIEMAKAEQFKGLNVPSPLAEKENYKRVVRARFRDGAGAAVDQMCEEIDQAPTDEEREWLRQQQQADMAAANLQAQAGVTPPSSPNEDEDEDEDEDEKA